MWQYKIMHFELDNVTVQDNATARAWEATEDFPFPVWRILYCGIWLTIVFTIQYTWMNSAVGFYLNCTTLLLNWFELYYNYNYIQLRKELLLRTQPIINTKGAFRLPATYDNHPIQPIHPHIAVKTTSPLKIWYNQSNQPKQSNQFATFFQNCDKTRNYGRRSKM